MNMRVVCGSTANQQEPARDLDVVQRLGKHALLRHFGSLVERDRGNTARMLAYIAEIDRRKLYLEHAHASMFAFCTERFRMSEAIAAKRIRAGRAACRFPCILDMVRRGELHLTGVHQLARHLTEENHAEILRRARYRSMREIEELIAEISPKPDAPSMIRAMPERLARAAGGNALQHEAIHPVESPLDSQVRSSSTRVRQTASRIEPLSPRRYRLQVTLGQEARDALAELQNLLSHRVPNGDPAVLVEEALQALLEKTKKRKAAVTGKPKRASSGKRKGKKLSRTRKIPASIRRQVFERDGGRCAFVSDEGQRCNSPWRVEFHHCVPYARDGPATVENIALRCRAHNQYEAELEYGQTFMAAARLHGAGHR